MQTERDGDLLEEEVITRHERAFFLICSSFQLVRSRTVLCLPLALLVAASNRVKLGAIRRICIGSAFSSIIHLIFLRSTS